MKERGWTNNGILVTVVLVLAAIALLVFIIMNVDISTKG